jgi:hypothetical protein
MDDKESRKHIFTSHTTSTQDSIITSESLELGLEEDILNQIIQGAESHGISPTSYINQIIKRYLEWDKFEPKAGIVPISKPVVKELFGNLSEEQIVSMAKNTSKNALQKTVIKFISDKQEQHTVEYEENQEKEKEKQKLDMNSFLSWLAMPLKLDILLAKKMVIPVIIMATIEIIVLIIAAVVAIIYTF